MADNQSNNISKNKNLEDDISTQLRKIGIDKLELNNIALQEINYSKLVCHTSVAVTYSHSPSALLMNGQNIKQIIIRDGLLFQSANIVSGFGATKVNTSIVFSVSLAHNGINVLPMSWTEYDTHIHRVVEHIRTEYGISMDVTYAKVRYIELTSNLSVLHAFSEYSPSLQLLMSFLPKNLRQQIVSRPESDRSTSLGSIYRKNKSREVVVYDKTYQLRQGQEASINQLIRLEIRIGTKSNHNSITQSLGTNYWRELNDIVIIEYFYDYFNKYFCEQYEVWYFQRNREITRMIKALRWQYPRRWHVEVVKSISRRTIQTGIPYVLDISQVEESLREVLRAEGSRNITRTIKTLHSFVQDGDPCNLQDWDLFLQDNLTKVSEIIAQIHENYVMSLCDVKM